MSFATAAVVTTPNNRTVVDFICHRLCRQFQMKPRHISLGSLHARAAMSDSSLLGIGLNFCTPSWHDGGPYLWITIRIQPIGTRRQHLRMRRLHRHPAQFTLWNQPIPIIGSYRVSQPSLINVRPTTVLYRPGTHGVLGQRCFSFSVEPF